MRTDDWPDEQQLLEGDIKHDAATKFLGIPARIAQHKWGDVYRAQKIFKQTQRQTGFVLALPAILRSKKQKTGAGNGQDEQEATLGENSNCIGEDSGSEGSKTKAETQSKLPNAYLKQKKDSRNFFLSDIAAQRTQTGHKEHGVRL